MKKIIPAVVCLLLCSCTTFPQAVAPVNNDFAGQHNIYIVSHGWHTGIVVPAAIVNRVLPQLDARFAQPKWYERLLSGTGNYQSPDIAGDVLVYWRSNACGGVLCPT